MPLVRASCKGTIAWTIVVCALLLTVVDDKEPEEEDEEDEEDEEEAGTGTGATDGVSTSTRRAFPGVAVAPGVVAVVDDIYESCFVSESERDMNNINVNISRNDFDRTSENRQGDKNKIHVR